MAGLSVEDIQADSNFIKYALEDSRACLRVYRELDVGFSRKERTLSAITRRIANRGLPIDGPLCQQFIEKMEKVLEDTPRQTTLWRQANLAHTTLEKLIMGQRMDRRVPTRLKYCGAPHTKRWSGAGLINFQAIPNDKVEGISVSRVSEDTGWARTGIGRLIADRTARNCLPCRRCRLPRPSPWRDRYLRGTWPSVQAV